MIGQLLYNHFLEAKRKSTTANELLPLLENVTLTPLTVAERKAVDVRRAGINGKADYRYWEFFKTKCGFDADFVADSDLMPIISRTLNPFPYYKQQQSKAFYPIYYTQLNQPRCYLLSINGTLYDNQMNPLERDNSRLARCFDGVGSPPPFIIKATIGSCSGRGVQKITVTDGFDYVNLFDKFGADFICQEVVKQSEQTAVFNTSSLNTFRISTLNINGRCTAENFLFRHGREGGFCDNGLANGLMVGINASGRLHPTAYDKHLTEYKVSPSGVKYADIQFRNFDKVVSFAIEAHKCYLPNMGFAGWDLCLDEQENIVFIEVNLGYPGILFEQLASSAPMFRTRTDEVYEYVLKHQHKLNWRTDFIGSAL